MPNGVRSVIGSLVKDGKLLVRGRHWHIVIGSEKRRRGGEGGVQGQETKLILTGRAAPDPPKQADTYLIYWKKPDEWGNVIYDWVSGVACGGYWARSLCSETPERSGGTGPYIPLEQDGQNSTDSRSLTTG